MFRSDVMRGVLAASFAALSFAQANSVFAQDADKTIVVTARSLKETAADLAACLARKCPPDEDVKATLAHAENQFVQGDYKAARSTLLKSVGRNNDAAKQFPVPVSDLQRANARIAAQLGEGDSYRLSTLDSRDALKAGLPEGDPRILASSIEVGEMRARLGYRDEAQRIFKDIAKEAESKGQKRIQWAAQMRQAFLLSGSSSLDDNKQGRDLLNKLAETAGDEASGLRLAAKVMLARDERKSGAENEEATKALIAEYAKSGATLRPTVLYAPKINLSSLKKRPKTGLALAQMATDNFDKQWIDVGFWITPDGKIQDAEVLRKSGKENAWAEAVLSSINGRIYAPLKRDPGDPGIYAVERYTFTSLMEDRTGTRVNQRSATGRIERIDLTPDQVLEGG
jgi:hypothetical protein